MNNNKEEDEKLVEYLINISDPEHPLFQAAALPGLRKAFMDDKYQYLYFKYLTPILTEMEQESKIKTTTLLASLFAYYNTGKGKGVHTNKGNIGTHLFQASKVDNNLQAIERRFENLLHCHSDDLPKALLSTIMFLKSKNEAINWKQLHLDIKYWNRPNQSVQKKWAQGFWGSQSKNNE